MDVDWCLHRETLTSSLSSPYTNPLRNGPYELPFTFPSRSLKVLELRQTKKMGLDLIQSPYAPRPSSLSHSMRRPLGKSPALVMIQYSMDSHVHLRHLEIQSHLR